MEDENISIEADDEYQSLARPFTIFMVGLIVLLSFSFFVFYATMRSRCMGIASGYLKAIETAYQTGEFRFNKEFPENNFETGIYLVHVSKIKSSNASEPIIVRIEIKDRFFSVIQYSEELKLIPMLDITTTQ
jgi:hypothetical protein